MNSAPSHAKYLRERYRLSGDDLEHSLRESETRLNAQWVTTEAQISAYRALVASGNRVDDALALARVVQQ